MSDEDLDLDALERLSNLVPHVGFIVDSSIGDDGKCNIGRNWLVANFGTDCHDPRFATLTRDGKHPEVLVTADHVPGSAYRSMGAGADADLVAALLTDREELIRLARIGQKLERKVEARAAELAKGG